MNIGIYEIIEFSKIYKRVMDLELRLKSKLRTALIKTFPNKMFFILKDFLKTNCTGKYIKKISGKKRDLLINLINSNKSEEAKLNKFIQMAYLSDVMYILTNHSAVYRDMKFQRLFYCQKVNFNDLKKYSFLMVKLRNNIMHFNINSYQQNKQNYLIALSYWEKQMMCEICFMHNLPRIKPTIKGILKQLSENMPFFFKVNDRIISDMFDDMAFLNGIPIKKLPSLWSIGREIYRLKSLNRKTNNCK